MSKPFVSLERRCNKLLFGISVSSIAVSKHKLLGAISSTKLVIHPGGPLSRAKGFREIPGKHRCLCSFALKKGVQKQQLRPGRDCSWQQFLKKIARSLQTRNNYFITIPVYWACADNKYILFLFFKVV